MSCVRVRRATSNEAVALVVVEQCGAGPHAPCGARRAGARANRTSHTCARRARAMRPCGTAQPARLRAAGAPLRRPASDATQSIPL